MNRKKRKLRKKNIVTCREFLHTATVGSDEVYTVRTRTRYYSVNYYLFIFFLTYYYYFQLIIRNILLLLRNIILCI